MMYWLHENQIHLCSRSSCEQMRNNGSSGGGSSTNAPVAATKVACNCLARYARAEAAAGAQFAMQHRAGHRRFEHDCG
jgi:hypothetical protein